MCLYKTHRFPKISTKPIKCYKVVEYLGDNNYESEFMGYRFKLGDTIKSARHWLFAIFNDELTDEVVHAYTFCLETKIDHGFAFCIETNETWIETWIECEIPPFTPYWIGRLGNIGAARIKTIKEVQKK